MIMNTKDRLHKIIANAGYCSRRKAEQIIAQGRVKVNGQVISEVGAKVSYNDEIEINGEVLKFNNYLYLVFNKPTNTLTTVSDPKNRPTVMEYFKDIKERIYPVGRLDFDTTGLLFFTNDGEFAHYILHPKHKINKIYEVTCQGILSEFQINLLIRGVRIENDFITSSAQVKMIKVDEKKNQTIIHLTIHEGHKNQVKKMLVAVGSKVLVLKRIQIANVTLKDLKIGQYRNLTKEEINHLIALSKNGNGS